MSNSGPPGWSIPETPAGPPWPDERPTPVDRPPSDPWGDQVPSAPEPLLPAAELIHEQAPPAPPAAEPALPAAPAPPAPEQPATDRRQTVLLLLVAVLALVLGAGGFTAYMLSDRADQPAGPNAAASRGAATTTAAAAPTGEFRAITAGECMVNDGTDEDPKPRRVACAPGTYEVLRRFDGTVDYAKNCATVAGYQFHFSYDSNLDTLDFVLCLRKQT